MTTRKTPKRLPQGVRLLPNGRYQARYPITENGVTRQISAGTFASARDAADARSRQLALLTAGAWVNPAGPRMTVQQWSEQWLELRRSGKVKAQSFLRSRIVPYWGAARLGDITPVQVKQWINALVDDGLSPATVKALYGCFKQMMTHAVEYDLLVKNPCRLIDNLPKQQRKRVAPLPVDKLVELEIKAPDRYRALIHLAANTGMRWGEIAALQWDAVDLERGLIHVFRSVARDGTVGAPKNGKPRWITIDPEAVDALRAHRRDYFAGDFVFTTRVQRRRLAYAEFRKAVWLPLIKLCGLSITFHELRHAHAGHLVMQGVDWKVLSDRLGHHAPSFSMDMYGWIRPDAHDVILRAMQDVKTAPTPKHGTQDGMDS